MRQEFYDYVKNEIKKIPNSSYLFLSLLLVKEEEFLLQLSNKYHLELINFNRESEYTLSDSFDYKSNRILHDTITYHYKVNNQLYLEYVVVSDNLKEDYPYILQDLTVYSNDINKNELISFIEYINEYLKNK